MKKISIKSLITLVFVVSISAIVFFGCKKDNTDCTAIVTVKYLNDTMQILPYADVIIAPNYPDVRAQGKSDATGTFQYVFKYEGILDIQVYKIIPPSDTVRGTGVIRLKPGETVSKTVFVQ